ALDHLVRDVQPYRTTIQIHFIAASITRDAHALARWIERTEKAADPATSITIVNILFIGKTGNGIVESFRFFP
ncbi:hypothetical protein C1Y07_30865, partial [Pseudomonas sp. FW306-02-F02-AB]